MAKVSEADMALMGRLLGRGEAGEKGAARIAALLDALNESESKLEQASEATEYRLGLIKELQGRLDNAESVVIARNNQIDMHQARIAELESRLGKIHSLMTKSYDPIPPGAAMGILMATIQEVAELSAGAVETLTVRVSDEELAELNRNAIARGQAPLTSEPDHAEDDPQQWTREVERQLSKCQNCGAEAVGRVDEFPGVLTCMNCAHHPAV